MKATEDALSDHLPLKQGLKPKGATNTTVTITTAFRSSSIKTRIETGCIPPIDDLHGALSDHLPLKQGLKQK